MIRMLLIFISLSYGMVFAQPKDISYQTIEDKSVSDIESRISKDLFFRGEVADYIIENDLARRITSKKFSSYSEAREFLIFWAAANPKTAAEFYSSAKARDPLALKGEISYVITSGGLTSRFKELVESLRQAASDSSLSDEQKRLASARLFEGFVEYGDGYVDVSLHRKADLNQPAPDNSADMTAFKLNAHSLFESERKIRELLPSFAKFASASSDKKTKDAFLLFKGSLEALSAQTAALGGRRNLTALEAEKIKRVLFSARRSSLSFFSLYLAESLRKIAVLLPASPLREKLLFWAKRLESNSSIFQNPSLTDSQANELLEFLSAQAAFAQKQAEAYFLCRSIEKKIEASGFSGYYDIIFYRLMNLFYPENEYRKIVLKMRESLLELALFKEKNLSLKLEEQDLQTDFLQSLNEMIIKRGMISAASLRMQFLCFEFFLPFEVKSEPGKIKIRLNSGKLFV